MLSIKPFFQHLIEGRYDSKRDVGRLSQHAQDSKDWARAMANAERRSKGLPELPEPQAAAAPQAPEAPAAPTIDAVAYPVLAKFYQKHSKLFKFNKNGSLTVGDNTYDNFDDAERDFAS